MKLDYCVYILFSLKDRLLYIGYTTNLRQRLEAHNKGYSETTAPRRPLKLIFCEYYLSIKDAKRREQYFKTTAGKIALKIMLCESLSEVNKMISEPIELSPTHHIVKYRFIYLFVFKYNSSCKIYSV
jgi:putative endonuclease